MLLNVDKDNGIMGWTMLPVYEIDRIENGNFSSQGLTVVPTQTNEIKPDKINFVWAGHNDSLPFLNWQIAHFRLLTDNLFLPYCIDLIIIICYNLGIIILLFL